jgi:hypothetical protein
LTDRRTEQPEHQRDEQIDDLELQEQDAEAVRGGAGVDATPKPTGDVVLKGFVANHNETLIRA